MVPRKACLWNLLLPELPARSKLSDSLRSMVCVNCPVCIVPTLFQKKTRHFRNLEILHLRIRFGDVSKALWILLDVSMQQNWQLLSTDASAFASLARWAASAWRNDLGEVWRSVAKLRQEQGQTKCQAFVKHVPKLCSLIVDGIFWEDSSEFPSVLLYS